MTTNNATNTINVVSGVGLAYQKILSLTASNSPALEFTGLSTLYRAYCFKVDRLQVASSAGLYMLSGASASYDTGGYTNISQRVSTASGPTRYASSDGGASEVRLTADVGIGTSADAGWQGTVDLIGQKFVGQPAAVTFAAIFYNENEGSRAHINGSARLGDNVGSGNTDRVKFFFNGQNIAAGTITLYGLLA